MINFNNKLRDELVCKEERATIRETYFLEFLRDPSLVKDYMDLLNSHTQEMYHGILASLDRLEVPAVGRVF